MLTQTTALGRTVPAHEGGAAFQDLVLKLLFDYWMSPFNSGKAPMPLPSLAKAARADAKEVQAVADSLAEISPPLVEKVDFQGGAYRITSSGVVFAQNAASANLP